MSWDHERVQELLAAQVLGGLDAEEAALAERSLIEHVPGCDRCREVLEAFRAVGGDLALVAAPVAPPETLRARLRHTVAAGRPLPRRMGWAVVAAGVVLAGALSGWNVVLAGRLSEAEVRQTWIVDAVSTLGHPEAGVVNLAGPVEGRVNVLYVPGEHRMYVVASGMREPEEGVYRVWLVHDDRTVAAGSFVPEKGVVMLPLERGAEGVRQILLTHEPTTDSPTPAASPLAEGTLEAG